MKVILFALLVVVFTKYHEAPCVVKNPNREYHVVTPEPYTYVNMNDLPDNWDWRNIDGGACWAINSLSPIMDRMKIMRKNAWPDFDLATQVLMNCVPGGCHGGDPADAYRYMRDHGVPTVGCQAFIAEGRGNDCNDFNICRTCDFDLQEPTKKCYAVKNFTKYYVEEYGGISGEAKMMAEIYARGPISCGIAVTQGVEDYTGGIFHDQTGARMIGHEISVVGWGVEDGTKFWVIRNSWGDYWGETGYMRLVRGINNLAIEDDCTWGTPKPF